MSSVNSNLLVLTEATSTWDSIKNGVVDGFNWIGRQVKWVGQSIADFMYKIYEFAKPFFVAVGKFIADSVFAIKEFFMENKQVSIGVVIGAALGIVGTTAIVYLFSGNKCSTKEEEKKAEAAKT